MRLPPTRAATFGLSRPKDRITDNTLPFAIVMHNREHNRQSLPADYEIGQQKLAEYHRFKGMCEVLAAVIAFITIALGLAGFFFDSN